MRSGVTTLAVVALVAACGGATEITVENLEGTWDATAQVYTNKANTSQTVDIVATRGATMTLVVQANGTTTASFNNGQGSTSTDSGTFNATGMTITLAGVSYAAVLDGGRLTLTNENAQFDFDNNGSTEPATVRITLRRR